MKAGDSRPGQGFRIEGKVCIIATVEHRTPGNLRAFVQLKYREIATGKYYEKRFNPAEQLEDVQLDRSDMEYLYSDGDGAVFMNPETYEQVTLPDAVIGEALLYLRPNTTASILSIDGVPAAVDLPGTVTLRVTDTQPGIKGATATNQLKPATCETGLQTRVPPFIEIGEEIRISTADGAYLSRAGS